MESKIIKFWALVDEEWTQLNDVTFSISHKDVKGELGDCGKVEEKSSKSGWKTPHWEKN